MPPELGSGVVAGVSSPPLPEQVATVPMVPPPHVPVPTAAPGEMEKALGTEFRNISFLWSGEQQDPVVTALVDWKDDLLCESLFPFPVV